jgi:hypothetical protein
LIGHRHFVHENAKFEGSVALGGLGTWDDDTDPTKTGVWLQGKLEFGHKHAASPLSWFVAYQADFVKDVNSDDPADRNLHQIFKIGVRLNAGGPTLLALDRAGAGTFRFPDFSVPFTYPDELF